MKGLGIWGTKRHLPTGNAVAARWLQHCVLLSLGSVDLVPHILSPFISGPPHLVLHSLGPQSKHASREIVEIAHLAGGRISVAQGRHFTGRVQIDRLHKAAERGSLGESVIR